MRKHPKLLRALRIIGYIVLATFVVVVNVVAGAFLYLKTNSAREEILAYGLKKAQPAFPGGVTLGKSEGDLTRGIVLYDIVLNDLDGRMAVEVKRLEVKYSLLALVLTRVQVDKVAVEGVTVVSRPLSDGRDNLSTMADVKMPKPPKHLPISVVLADLKVQARFVQLKAGVPIERAPHDTDVRAEVYARAGLSHGMVASLDQLRVDLTSPAHATIEAQGAAHVVDKVDLRRVRLRITGDTTELRRKVEKMELTGPALIAVEANGAIDDLRASLAVDLANPNTRLRAGAHLYADRVELLQLVMASPFADVDARGIYRFDQTGEGKVHVDASDLRPLQLFGAPKIGGSVKLDAEAKKGEELTAHATGLVRNFRIENNRINRISLDAKVAGLSGHAKVDATELVVGGMTLRVVQVGVDGDTKGVRLRVDGHGNEGIDLELRAMAVPRIQDKKVLGLEATLERLRLRGGGTPWQEDHPAHLSADFQTNTFALSPLGLSNNKQHLTVEGRLMGKMIENVHVALEHFDLSQLSALMSPGHVLPHTDLEAKMEAHGTMDRPSVHASFAGAGDGRSARDLIRFHATGEGALEAGRLDAKTFVTIGGQKASATISLPIPLAPDQRVEGSVNASVLLNPWFADLLVPKAISSEPIILYTLGAKVTAQGSLSGTTSDPQIHASMRVARWGADNAHGDFAISGEYAKKHLGLSSTLTLSSLPEGGGKAAGVVEATGELPIDLAPALSGTDGKTFNRRAPWAAAINLKHIDISRLPFEALNIVPLVRHGTVDGTATLAGTYNHPKANAHLEARDLDFSGMNQVSLISNAKLDGAATTGDLAVSVRGDEALRAQGSLGEGESWRDAPLAITANTPNFDLTRVQLLKQLQGVLSATAKVTGTIDNPKVVARASVAGLRSGETAYKKLEAEATFKDERLGMLLNAVEVDGSSLEASGEVPLRGGKLQGTIDAKRFKVEVVSELLPRIRVLRGELDGKLVAAGTSQKPSLSGTLVVSKGQATLSSSAVTYRDIAARLDFAENAINIDKLRMTAGTGGTLDGSAKVTIRDLRTDALTGQLTLKRYPVQWDTTLGLVDSVVTLDGKRDPKTGFATRVSFDKGARIDLQDDRTPGLLPTARLDDVKVGNARPEPIAVPLSGKHKADPKHMQRNTVVVKGTADVHGPELDVKATADITLALDTDIPTAVGTVLLAPRGAVRMFGQTYDLEHGRIVFGNLAQPTLDLRMARHVPTARIGVDIGGTAREPTTKYWAIPPSLTPVAVASQITAQPEKNDAVAKDGLNKKVTGPISHLIALSFRQAEPDKKAVDVTRNQPQSAKR